MNITETRESFLNCISHLKQERKEDRCRQRAAFIIYIIMLILIGISIFIYNGMYNEYHILGILFATNVNTIYTTNYLIKKQLEIANINIQIFIMKEKLSMLKGEEVCKTNKNN